MSDIDNDPTVTTIPITSDQPTVIAASVIIPPAPDSRVAELEAIVASYKQALAEVDAVIDPLIGTGAVHRADFIKEQLAKLDGAEASRNAAQIERDAARLALDASLLEPCSICGKQRKDTP